eukprot:CAMPEP_0184486988 /NCGR_PEP_ID=MMETSP0113_2-20130426/8874_1 /TAXON_ID=91329 /ORGANISM="Norrisiella sphaerica, Strain BC52" /LENGTH=214 /DNA_ID=CAMNT_0026869089 /DNA_START=128 /DNA_END=773 /DNA_ORIENTATION=+
MKDYHFVSGETGEREELLERFRCRVEEETKLLVDLGVPYDKVEKILINRIRSEEEKEPQFEDSEVRKVIVEGRMRMAEAKRALVLNEEIRKLVSEGSSLEKALIEILERLSKPKPSVMDELRRTKGLENGNVLSECPTKKPEYVNRQGKLGHILKCPQPLSERPSPCKFNGKNKSSSPTSVVGASTPAVTATSATRKAVSSEDKLANIRKDLPR